LDLFTEKEPNSRGWRRSNTKNAIDRMVEREYELHLQAFVRGEEHILPGADGVLASKKEEKQGRLPMGGPTIQGPGVCREKSVG